MSTDCSCASHPLSGIRRPADDQACLRTKTGEHDMKQLKLKSTYGSINFDYIVHNYKETCKKVSNAVTVSCIVKSDAYGHGEMQVVEALIENGLSVICVSLSP